MQISLIGITVICALCTVMYFSEIKLTPNGLVYELSSGIEPGLMIPITHTVISAIMTFQVKAS